MNKDYFHNKCKCGKIKSNYARLCKSCHLKKLHKLHRGINHPNWKGGANRTKKCILCGKKLHLTSIYRNYNSCLSCSRLGKNNPNYKHGKTDKNTCKNCGKHICDAATYCNKCEKLIHKKQLIKTLLKIKNHKHHLDLNKNNNKKSNIWILPKGKHQLFHRFAYHYLLEKFGIIEILKYKKWFKKKYLKDACERE